MQVTNDGGDFIALNRDSQCPEGSAMVHFGKSARKKTPIKQGVFMEVKYGTRDGSRERALLGAIWQVREDGQTRAADSGISLPVETACHR